MKDKVSGFLRVCVALDTSVSSITLTLLEARMVTFLRIDDSNMQWGLSSGSYPAEVLEEASL